MYRFLKHLILDRGIRCPHLQKSEIEKIVNELSRKIPAFIKKDEWAIKMGNVWREYKRTLAIF